MSTKSIPHGTNIVLSDTLHFVRNPFKWMSNQRKQYGDVFSINLLGKETVFCFDPEAVEAFMWDREVGYRGTDAYKLLTLGLPHTVLSMGNYAEWKERRGVLKTAYMPEGYESQRGYKELMIDSIYQMMNRWDSQSVTVIDTEKEFQELSLEIILKLMFGRNVSNEILETIPKAVQSILKFMTTAGVAGTALGSFLYKKGMEVSIEEANKAMLQLIVIAKQTKPEVDREYMIDVFLSKLENNEISKEDMMYEFLTALMAGSETTGHTLPWGILRISNDPRIQDIVFKEVSSFVEEGILSPEGLDKLVYTKFVQKETVRDFSAVPTLGRRLLVDLHIEGGYVLKKGSDVNTMPWIMNHSDRLFDNPFNFYPERWLTTKSRPATSLTFGGFQRCMGEIIANMEINAVLAIVTHRYKLTPINSGMPREVFGTTISLDKGEKKQLVRIERRH